MPNIALGKALSYIDLLNAGNKSKEFVSIKASKALTLKAKCPYFFGPNIYKNIIKNRIKVKKHLK